MKRTITDLTLARIKKHGWRKEAKVFQCSFKADGVPFLGELLLSHDDGSIPSRRGTYDIMFFGKNPSGKKKDHLTDWDCEACEKDVAPALFKAVADWAKPQGWKIDNLLGEYYSFHFPAPLLGKNWKDAGHRYCSPEVVAVYYSNYVQCPLHGKSLVYDTDVAD